MYLAQMLAHLTPIKKNTQLPQLPHAPYVVQECILCCE